MEEHPSLLDGALSGAWKGKRLARMRNLAEACQDVQGERWFVVAIISFPLAHYLPYAVRLDRHQKMRALLVFHVSDSNPEAVYEAVDRQSMASTCATAHQLHFLLCACDQRGRQIAKKCCIVRSSSLDCIG